MDNKRTNVVFINVDQLNLEYISGYGCKYTKTPNIDRLIENGTSFMYSYSAEPICTASRASWWTGRYPQEHGVVYNSTDCHDDMIDLGQHLKNNDSNAVFIGHWHINGKNVEESFDVTHVGSTWGEITDQEVTKSARAVISNYNSDKPLFLNVGYFNPHDCCITITESIIGDIPKVLEKGIINEEALPPLPSTYNYDNEKNATVEHVLTPHSRTNNMNDIKWRYYLYQYARLVEMIDFEIGAVLDEIENSPLRDNTVIIFTCDHGESAAGHKMNGKCTLWEESVRVPFIISSFSDKFGISKGKLDNEHFVSGVDLFPTVCDIMGIESPESLSGISIYGSATGDGIANPREFAYSQAVYYTRMIRTKRYKYIMDYEPRIDTISTPPSHKTNKIHKELLYDMEDQGERLNLSKDKQYAEILEQHRNMLFDMEDKLEIRDLKTYNGKPSLLIKNLENYFKYFNINY